ncbi:MAG TPA: alginate lyase family protein [Methylomirabilota bacterium]|nr:alginate lyase family protein [Methylomirabilota bacterium]
MSLARLFRMPLPEVVGRARQELRKRLERAGAAAPAGRPGVFGELARTPDLEAVRARARAGDRGQAARMLLDRFGEAGPARFFEGAASSETAALREVSMVAGRDEVLAAADSICDGRFDLLGYRGLSFGDPVDWHLDPVSGRRAPLVHWSRLEPLDADAVGDSKVIWELNRHQWMVRLGQAYRLTGDERYAQTFAGSVRAWLDANPPGFGINWASSLELSLRLIAWCWALCLFRGTPALSPELYAEMLESIGAHALHVERYLSRYFSPNTHLTGEALGLFYAGVVVPELRAAASWRRLGERILVQESGRQVLADGVHFELSTCYQRYTVEIYLHFLVLAARNRVPVAPEVAARVERLLDVLLTLRQPDGSMPQIGDADGGFLLPLAPRGPDDLRGLFAVAAAVFERPDFAWAAGGSAPETLWLLGPAAAARLQTLVPRPPPAPLSRVFPHGGYVVMRSGWDRQAHQLILDAGPLGCPVSAGHGHADLLSIQCAVFGEPYIVDPGTCCYTGQGEWRDFFRGTAAHSTVRVDRLGQASPRGPFGWNERPRARLHRWLCTDALEVAEAAHGAYERLADPVTHRRRVLWVKRRYWVIVDDLAGQGEHEVELRFQFAPMEVTVTPALWARARGTRGSGLLVRPFAAARLKADVRSGEPAPIQGWVSQDYGQRRAAPVVIYSAVTRLPLRIATLLYPIQDPLATPPSVSLLEGEDAGAVGLSFDDGGEIVLFGGREQIVAGAAVLAAARSRE